MEDFFEVFHLFCILHMTVWHGFCNIPAGKTKEEGYDKGRKTRKEKGTG